MLQVFEAWVQLVVLVKGTQISQGLSGLLSFAR